MIKEEMTIIVFVLLFWASVFFVLYTYFGYPIILEFLAGFKRTQIDYPEHFPTITLLIAAYNEEASIEEKIKNSLALQYPVSKLQILVAADGSTDHTPDIVRAYADQGVDLSYIPERGGKMAAIVRALSTMAHGEVVIISIREAKGIFEFRTCCKEGWNFKWKFDGEGGVAAGTTDGVSNW